MTSDASTMDQPLLSSKEAGALLGYTHDYISKLCREGKMSGVQKGRVWYVTEAEARAFKERHEAELEIKKAQLSQKFSAIRLEHESKRKDQTQPASAVPENLPGTVVGSVDDVPEPFVPAFFTSPVLASEGAVEIPDEPVTPIAIDDKPEVVSRVPEAIVASEIADSPVEAGEAGPYEPVAVSTNSAQKQIQFALPKQFAALAVLALIVFGPSLASSLNSEVDSVSLPAAPAYVSDIADNLDEGVAAVIETQSELVARTADAYGFVQYLNDGYLALAYNAVELSKGSYGVLNDISGAYLTVYEMQGETVLDSIYSIGDMGSTVVQGYELVGESLVVGTKNVIDSYADFLLVDSYAENLKKK